VRWPVLVAPALALAACTGPAASESSPFVLDAELVTPTDIALSWHGGTDDAAANVVEFATEPDGRYTILEFLPPDRTTFEHPDLMPSTPFYYRIRPVHGPASDEVDVSMADAPPTPPPGDWSAPRTIPSQRAHQSGLGRPTDLSATVVAPDGVRFTWTDNAADETGYLLESSPASTAGYRVVAVLDRDVNAVGLVMLPEERLASYRVRAYVFGAASTVAHETTG
jgi:hypothetical protein